MKLVLFTLLLLFSCRLDKYKFIPPSHDHGTVIPPNATYYRVCEIVAKHLKADFDAYIGFLVKSYDFPNKYDHNPISFVRLAIAKKQYCSENLKELGRP